MAGVRLQQGNKQVLCNRSAAQVSCQASYSNPNQRAGMRSGRRTFSGTLAVPRMLTFCGEAVAEPEANQVAHTRSPRLVTTSPSCTTAWATCRALACQVPQTHRRRCSARKRADGGDMSFSALALSLWSSTASKAYAVETPCTVSHGLHLWHDNANMGQVVGPSLRADTPPLSRDPGARQPPSRS